MMCYDLVKQGQQQALWGRLSWELANPSLASSGL
jgi:hypothetical protein